ncbi:hypothetical protein EV143_107301 [Flavobacterium chryseum]|uniref:hypothetical protein n=1 Tax=Flavobacterium sp. P3160 TaxID=2512113 RepID=UPI00105DA1A1|nr:hypothetical protein [Flavobacterium sp. P3160]TDO72994.1 hypothetical protein EV143_107301 [Flavobacterium sp. P3160]
MEKTLQKFENWIVVIQKSILVLAGIEVLIVLIIGVASNNVTNNTNSLIWSSILIILGILYVMITIIKIAYNKSFPISIVNELTSKKKLEISLSEINRKDAINNYISNTIIALSQCKCEIPRQQEESDWEKYSDDDFTKGLKDVLNIFNSILNILLNTTNFKFSTGIYVEHFRGIGQNNRPKANDGMFLIRDDYELTKSDSIRNLMKAERPSGIKLEIQNAIKISLHNGKYKTKTIKVNENRKVLLICANIKNLKNDDQKGVLFIITEPLKKLPDDIESVFKVFTNILSHWLDLYEHEVISRQIQIMGEEIQEDEKVLTKKNEETDFEEIK